MSMPPTPTPATLAKAARPQHVTGVPDPALIGGRYEVLRPLGRGTFAQTLLARDVQLGRQVTLKVLRARSESFKAYDLFEREAAVLRELKHPGVPKIHTTLRADWEGADSAFLVMEYVEGSSLAELIADRRHLESDEVHRLFLELLDVLDYLHSRVPPVLHRDIKPANLIVRTDGAPVLVDFGAVRNVFRAADDDGSTVVGTYGYMPYEQYMGQASPASDLYALGATFLHLLTGRPPPEFMTTAGRLEVPANLPCGDPLRRILVRLLSPAQADRYQSAKEVKAAMFGTSVALVPGEPPPLPADSGLQQGYVARSEPLDLGPTPRSPQEAAELVEAVAPTAWELMDTAYRGGKGHQGILDLLLFGFFSIVTIGILPAVFWGMARTRRRRLKPFAINGLPATARVRDMATEKTAFDEKISRVRYEFEVEGRRYRGSDQVLPQIAERWDPGDLIQILYLPGRDCDSVIISTS
jgi:hypothetical protein